MADVYLVEDALAAYDGLRSDPARADLLRRVDAVLDQLEYDPGDVSVRRHRFPTTLGGVWMVNVWDRDEPWWLLWAPEGEGVVLVSYLGPEPA
jgi:hypothetical protein